MRKLWNPQNLTKCMKENFTTHLIDLELANVYKKAIILKNYSIIH